MANQNRIWQISDALVAIGAVLMAAPVVRAAEGQPTEVVGRFSVAEFGAVAGLGSTPIGYSVADRWGTNQGTVNVMGGFVGPNLQLHVDADALLLNVEGVYSVVGGHVDWMARAQIVLGTGLGVRSTHNVIKAMYDSAPAYGYVTRTTEIYVHKHVPIFFGLSGGVALWRAGASSYTSSVYGTVTRDAALLPVGDIGFTVKSPQIELTLAPFYEIRTRSKGWRWVIGMAFPWDNIPIFFRMTGDHFLGADSADNSGRRLISLLLLNVGFGTTLDIDGQRSSLSDAVN